MAKGFTDDKGNFRPTRRNGRTSSRRKTTSTGITPREPFALRERVQLLDEDQLSRDFTFDELTEVQDELKELVRSRYLDLNPDVDFIDVDTATRKAFDFAEEEGDSLDPDLDILLTELRKVNGASNQKTMRSLGGAQIFDPEPTGFPEIDEMRR